MFENLSESTTILTFRLCISLLIGSISLLSCFVGKLLKERSIFHYNHFRTFCCGILLAKGFADIFLLREISKEVAAILFSSTFLLLYIAKSLYISSRYDYNQVSAVDLDSMDDDEDLDIEISDHVPSFLRKDRSERGVLEIESSPSSTDETANRKISMLWFFSVLIAIMLNEASKGIILGSQQHDTIYTYEQVIADGLLEALAFGVVCEESLTTGFAYLTSIMFFVASKPLGVVIGNFSNHNMIISACNWMMLFTSGVFLAFAVFQMIPTDETQTQLHQESALTIAKRDQRCSKIIRAIAFIIGYLLTFVLQFL